MSGWEYLSLDVRVSWEWAVGNLAAHGARPIPLSEIGERIGEIPSDRLIVVFCRWGQRSMAAGRRIASTGSSEVPSSRGVANEIKPDLRVV